MSDEANWGLEAHEWLYDFTGQGPIDEGYADSCFHSTFMRWAQDNPEEACPIPGLRLHSFHKKDVQKWFEAVVNSERYKNAHAEGMDEVVAFNQSERELARESTDPYTRRGVSRSDFA